jgi:hypothetical protein
MDREYAMLEGTQLSAKKERRRKEEDEESSEDQAFPVELWKVRRTEFLQRQIKVLEANPAKAALPAIKEKIDELKTDLKALSPVPALPGSTRIVNIQQDVVPRKSFWNLSQEGTRYHTSVPGQEQKELANGSFVFVVPMDPREVRLGERSAGGHTAVSRGADVYFAGEIEFDQGRLIRWTNESGHYRPHTDLHRQIEDLLPKQHYHEIERN